MSNDDLEEDRETRIENLKRKMKKGDSPIFSGPFFGCGRAHSVTPDPSLIVVVLTL